MDEDSMEPGLEAFGFAERRQLPPRSDERLLDGVLGAPDVAQDPMCDDEQPVSRAASDGGEGLLVPGPRRLDECEVHPSRSQLRGPSWDASSTMSAVPGESG